MSDVSPPTDVPIMRLEERPGEVIDRTTSLSFRWNGTALRGFSGDTIASAIAASGVRVLSRSFKYRRPRGLLTADYNDPNCFFQVNGEPNVRGAHRLLEDGMEVSAQNVWPSLRFDARAVTGVLAPFLGPGFYYKTFMRPRVLWPWYQRVLRMFSAGGKVVAGPNEAIYEKRYTHPDVLVAGAGPAGMAAAIGAAEYGAKVVLVEEEHQTGGHLRWGGPHALEALAELRSRLRNSAIEVLTDSVVFGRYDHNWIGVVQRTLPGGAERLIKARAGVLVAAPGLIERPFVFEGNDLPGVMLSGGVMRLLNLYAVRPGARVVVLSANGNGDEAAADLEAAGVEIAAFVDVRRGETVTRARGRKALRSVELGDGRVVDADLLVTATGWTAPTSLLNMAGSVPMYDERSARFIPGDLPDDLIAVGGIVGDGTLDEIVLHGIAAGREAARRAARTAAAKAAAIPAATALPAPPDDPQPLPNLVPDPHPAVFTSSTNGFVDFSEDVTTKDLAAAAAEGYQSLELTKRYTTVTMGPIQGKLEVVNAAAIHMASAGRDVSDIGTTTWRPPYAPLSLAALAGQNFEPVRYSPLQEYHDLVAAEPIVAGQWIRPNRYEDPQDEVRAVRASVGIIDVSPLGKIDLRGIDVPRLLEMVYVNRWSKLPVGSVRYGVMCSEDGVVLDDGVTGRLTDSHYIMTTTSSGAAGIYDWLEEWVHTADRRWNIRITPVTDAFASINVAGPQSRRLMQRMSGDIDLSREAFPYMRVRTGAFAGVAGCFIWRIGFTGELSFEVHVPSGYGLAVWEAMLDAGRDLGIVPFGLEAQRIMRLEKGHFIVGQDTDGLTKAESTGLGALIKTDKPDFAGRPELVWNAGRARTMLVGLQPNDGMVVPPESSQIVDGSAIIGRVTSSRMSPTLGRSICLAQIDSIHAVPGSTVTIKVGDGSLLPAKIMEHHAHFDPEGTRLRG